MGEGSVDGAVLRESSSVFSQGGCYMFVLMLLVSGVTNMVTLRIHVRTLRCLEIAVGSRRESERISQGEWNVEAGAEFTMACMTHSTSSLLWGVGGETLYCVRAVSDSNAR